MAKSLKSRLVYRVLIVQRSPWLPISLRRWLLNRLGARIHPTAEVSFGFRIYHPEVLVMGAYSSINANCYFDGPASLVLDEYARIGSNATMFTGAHPIMPATVRRDISNESDTAAPIRIGRGCWIGSSVTIMPGVDVADGCVIGAQSLLTRSTEPDGLYVNMAGGNGAVYARRLRDLPNNDRDVAKVAGAAG